MRYLKSILLALAISVVLLGGAGFFLSPSYKVERVISIHAKPDSLFPLIVDLKKWPSWSAWNLKKDPSLKLTYEGPEKGVGAKQKWEGESMETGEITITEVKANRELSYRMELEKEFAGNGTISLEPSGRITRIRWKTEGDVGYNIPQRYFILFMENLIGPDMEEGLRNLKNISERP